MKTSDYFEPQFLQEIMQEQAAGSSIEVQKVSRFPVDNSASILSTLNAGNTGLEIGHFGLKVTYQKDSKIFTRKMVMKVKPNGEVTANMLNSLSMVCGDALNSVYEPFKNLTGFRNTHMRELEVYEKLPAPIQPEIFGLKADLENDIYIILMENLEEVELLNSVMQPDLWTPQYIEAALSQIAKWHAALLDKAGGIDQKYWKEDVPSKEYMLKLQPLWTALLEHASKNLPELYTPENKAILEEAIKNIPQYWTELEAMPKTLVHNDFNPRNVCFKAADSIPDLCLYDWELATYNVPQYDIAEFLSFVLTPENYEQRLEYLEFYRQELHGLTGTFDDKAQFKKGFAFAALDFGLHRLGMYVMAHTVGPYPFLPRVIHSYFDTLKQVRHLLP